MHLIAKYTVAGGLVALLAGCAGAELDRAKQVSPTGTAFENGLCKGYVAIASWEQGESDYEDADAFALRAISAAGGKGVEPEGLADWALPKDKVGELGNDRQRIVAALTSGARDKAPAQAAHAQVMFDCWMQEQEENFQPSDISKCRGAFMTAMASVEEAVRSKPMAKAKPAPKPMVQKAKFLVYFPFDSDKITPESKRVILEAIDARRAWAPSGFRFPGIPIARARRPTIWRSATSDPWRWPVR